MLNQLEMAVDLALVYDVDVAKDIAKLAKNSDEMLHKKIWLKIGMFKVRVQFTFLKTVYFSETCDRTR